MKYKWHICFGGPILQIAEGNGRRFTFEMHHYCGPMRVHAQTGEPTKHPFPDDSAFWPLFERWQANGSKVDKFGRCVLS